MLFSRDPAVFGFQSSSPPDNITLNPSNRKTDQNLIFRLALVQLLMLFLIWSSLFLIPEWLLLIPVQEVLGLLTKIHDILEICCLKGLGIHAHIFVSLKLASRQHCDVWASQ